LSWETEERALLLFEHQLTLLADHALRSVGKAREQPRQRDLDPHTGLIDIKEAGGRCFVMEVNDNPNIDAGNEDAVEGDALYREILGVFRRRIRQTSRLPVP